jgi:hypothetical protein
VSRRIFSRFLQRGRNLLRGAIGEQARLEIEGMIVRRHLC